MWKCSTELYWACMLTDPCVLSICAVNYRHLRIWALDRPYDPTNPPDPIAELPRLCWNAEAPRANATFQETSSYTDFQCMDKGIMAQYVAITYLSVTMRLELCEVEVYTPYVGQTNRRPCIDHF